MPPLLSGDSVNKFFRGVAIMGVCLFTFALAHAMSALVTYMTSVSMDPWHMVSDMALALVVQYNAFKD